MCIYVKDFSEKEQALHINTASIFAKFYNQNLVLTEKISQAHFTFLPQLKSSFDEKQVHSGIPGLMQEEEKIGSEKMAFVLRTGIGRGTENASLAN